MFVEIETLEKHTRSIVVNLRNLIIRGLFPAISSRWKSLRMSFRLRNTGQ